jgi:hypothetical protein
MKKLVFVCLTLFAFAFSFAGNPSMPVDTVKKEKEKTWKVFGAIYGGFYSMYNPPKSAFEVKTGILGYKNQFAENVDAIIMLDVSKTTRDIKNKYDTATITFTEGNNYTFYLKQAEIHWKIHALAELSLGQLLSSQYLLTQDKWWDHRYINYTFQEVIKYGPPADFGARLKLNPHKQISVSLCMLNGEGPARWQDDNSKYLYSADVEYRNNDSIVFRIYGDYREPTIKTAGAKAQSVFNFFAGYAISKFKFGAEYSYVYQANFSKKDVMGLSGYVLYKFLKKLEAIGRYDYYQDITSYKENHYLIAGIQYEPAKNFFLAANFREIWPAKSSQIYLNFGAKF